MYRNCGCHEHIAIIRRLRKVAVFGKPESGTVCGLFAGSKGAIQFNWNTNFNPQTTRKQSIWQTCKRPANNVVNPALNSLETGLLTVDSKLPF
jgi:hypothetical protein